MSELVATSVPPTASLVSNDGTHSGPLNPYTEQGTDELDQYESITALATYSNYSHEELRVVDYQRGRAGEWTNRSAQDLASGFLAAAGGTQSSGTLKVPFHIDLLRGAAIRVSVGQTSCTCPDSKSDTCNCSDSWCLPTALISHFSPFLKAACTREFRERTENRIKLPKDDPTVFAMYVRWLYYGRYTSPAPKMFESDPDKLISMDVKCWIMGDKLLDIDFKNYAMCHLYKQYVEPDHLARAITTHEMRFVLENTGEGSGMRQLFLHLAFQHFTNPMRIKGATQMWDELLMEHADAMLLSLQSLRLPSKLRNFVQAKEYYMHRGEPLLETVRKMEPKEHVLLQKE